VVTREINITVTTMRVRNVGVAGFKKVDNTKLSFWDKLVPGYKRMWEIGKNQNWKCYDCGTSIANDPEWITHVVEGISTCENCGRKRWGNTIQEFKD